MALESCLLNERYQKNGESIDLTNVKVLSIILDVKPKPSP